MVINEGNCNLLIDRYSKLRDRISSKIDEAIVSGKDTSELETSLIQHAT